MKALLPVLIFMLCHLSSGAQVLEKGDFLPQAGDCYQKVRAEAGPGEAGDDCIWYYSAASCETDLSSVVAKPGGFSMLSRDWQMHYVLQGDSLLETGRENRLTEATYGENTTLLSNPNRYTERVVEYSSNGAMKRFQRHGLKNDGVYGKIDNLHIALEGNRIASVIDDAGYVTRAGANDFRQGADNRMTYNAAGALLSDGNRGIARIDYDRFGRPRRAQFTSGSLTEWVYTATGEKIRTIHTTVADGVTVPLGGEVEITPAMVLHSDTTEYAGEFVWENGRIKRALYPGGFASYDDAGNCAFNYYTADHVGNVRAVTDEYGMVVQRTDYYPFGSVIADRGFGSGVQPYKTAGKETDLMHGLDVADFGARLYNPTLPQWDRPDDHATSYTQYSPYIYCADNPVNIVDPDGRDAQIIIEGNNITIKANIFLMGELTTNKLVKVFQEDIDNKWGTIKKVRYLGKVYSINWDVQVHRFNEKTDDIVFNGYNNYLEVITSYVSHTNYGFINGKNEDGRDIKTNSSMSHEFGHILGLKDKYVKNERDPKGLNYYRPVSEKWRGNIMYETPGNPSTVDSKNLTPLLKPALDIHNSRVKRSSTSGNKKIRTFYQINEKQREK